MHIPFPQDFACTKLCLIPSKELLKEVGVDARIPMGSSTNDSLGKIPIGSNPTNQMTKIGKFPIGFNPPQVLCNSFESKEP